MVYASLSVRCNDRELTCVRQITEALFCPFHPMALQLSLPIPVNLKVTTFKRGTSLESIS